MTKNLTTALMALIIFLSACNQNKQRVKQQAHEADNAVIDKSTKGKTQFPTDTLLITERAAVLAIIDTNEIAKRRKKTGEQDFSAIADDDTYYAAQADSTLKALDLKVLRTNGRYKYLKFVQLNKLTRIIRIDTLPGISNVFLFDPRKAPRAIDMTDASGEYDAFFKAPVGQ